MVLRAACLLCHGQEGCESTFTGLLRFSGVYIWLSLCRATSQVCAMPLVQQPVAMHTCGPQKYDD